MNSCHVRNAKSFIDVKKLMIWKREWMIWAQLWASVLLIKIDSNLCSTINKFQNYFSELIKVAGLISQYKIFFHLNYLLAARKISNWSFEYPSVEFHSHLHFRCLLRLLVPLRDALLYKYVDRLQTRLFFTWTACLQQEKIVIDPLNSLQLNCVAICIFHAFPDFLSLWERHYYINMWWRCRLDYFSVEFLTCSRKI